MNPSKIRDPRQWEKWSRAGAVETFPRACCWCGERVCICFSVESFTSESWLCIVGHFHEDGLHCPTTGQEPPWGCPCGHCQGDDDVDEDDPLTYFPP